MIYQHIITRCRRGFFDSDTTLSAGYKPVVLSQNMQDFQQAGNLNDILNYLMNRGSLPDTLDVPDTMVSNTQRGIIRTSCLGPFTIVSRAFRVGDLCDNRGTVNFVHSYVLSEQDRTAFLEHPEVVTVLQNFDTYQNLNMRCNGLANGNYVPLDASVELMNHCPAPVDLSIFQKCGFNEDTFSALISALCDRVSIGGRVALAVPSITQGSWDQEGGSLLGEQLICAVYSILPDCLTRFMGAISYWDDIMEHKALDGVQFVIVANNQNPSLYSDSISLIDLNQNAARNVSSFRDFGRFLWKHLDDIGAIKQFNSYIKELFGEHVDEVRKHSYLMDMVTHMYLSSNGASDDAYRRLADISLELFGNSFHLFPNIEKNAVKYFEVEKKYAPHSQEMEARINLSLANVEIQRLSIFSEMVFCLIQNIDIGSATEQTVTTIAALLKDNNDVALDQIFEYLSSVDSKDNYQVSDKLMELLSAVYNDKDALENKDIKEKVANSLAKHYQSFLEKRQWDRCLVVLRVQAQNLQKDTLSEAQVEDLYRNMWLLFLVGDERSREEIGEIFTQEMTSVYAKRQTARVTICWQQFYKLAIEYLKKFQEMLLPVESCEMLIQFLPLFFMESGLRKKYMKEFEAEYTTLYKHLIQNYENHIITNNQLQLMRITGEDGYQIPLAMLEKLKLTHGTYLPSGQECVLLQRILEPKLVLSERIVYLYFVYKKSDAATFCAEIGANFYLYYLFFYAMTLQKGQLSLREREVFYQEIHSHEKWPEKLAEAIHRFGQEIKDINSNLFCVEFDGIWNSQPMFSQPDWNADYLKQLILMVQELENLLKLNISEAHTIYDRAMNGVVRTSFANTLKNELVYQLSDNEIRVLAEWAKQYGWNSKEFDTVKNLYTIQRFYRLTDIQRNYGILFNDSEDNVRIEYQKRVLSRINQIDINSEDFFRFRCNMCMLYCSLARFKNGVLAEYWKLALPATASAEQRLKVSFYGMDSISDNTDCTMVRDQFVDEFLKWFDGAVRNREIQEALVQNGIYDIYQKLPRNDFTIQNLRSQVSLKVRDCENEEVKNKYCKVHKVSTKRKWSEVFLFSAIAYLLCLIIMICLVIGEELFWNINPVISVVLSAATCIVFVLFAVWNAICTFRK